MPAHRGIARFPHERPGSGDHTLHHCFRCSPRVLDAAQTLIRKHAADGRIEKHLVSLWADADPPVPGALGCWSFVSGRAEARAIAESCQQLIGAGMEPSQIMILLSSKTTPGRDIQTALDELEVPYAPVDEENVTDTEPGRVGYALLSVVVELMNYVAHRSLFGLRQGVGLGTCNDLAKAVIAHNRNYRDLFYSPVPDGLAKPGATSAIAHTADVCAELAVAKPSRKLGRADEPSVESQRHLHRWHVPTCRRPAGTGSLGHRMRQRPPAAPMASAQLTAALAAGAPPGAPLRGPAAVLASFTVARVGRSKPSALEVTGRTSAWRPCLRWRGR